MTKTRRIFELKKQNADLQTTVNLQGSIIESLEDELGKANRITERFSPKSPFFLMDINEMEKAERDWKDTCDAFDEVHAANK